MTEVFTITERFHTCEVREAAQTHDAFREAFHGAAGRQPVTTQDARLARRPVLLEHVGADWDNTFHPAMAHLLVHERQESPQALVIRLWDEATTGVPAPNGYRHPGTAEDHPRRWYCRLSKDQRYLLFIRGHSVASMDRAAREVIVWYRNTSTLPGEYRAEPFEQPIAMWLNDLGVQLLHAAALAIDGQALIVTGPSGSGKSTTTLSLLHDRWQAIGDDTVFTEPVGTQTRVYSADSSLKVTADHYARFPHQLQYPATTFQSYNGKPIAFLGTAAPERLATEAVARALIAPHIEPDSVCAIEPLPRALALRQLVLGTVIGAGQTTRTSLDRLTDLAVRLPAFRLRLGSDVDSIPRLLREALARVTPS